MRGLAPKTALFLPILLAACQPPRDDASEAATAEATIPEPTGDEATPATKSIIRAEVSPAPTEPPLIAPEQITLPFPDKGYRPDAAEFAMVDRLLTGAAFQTGGPITVWGHSDSRGSDRDNLAASRRRAETIAEYLEHKGVPADRITVIALGEARPIAPNRKLDGSDDPEGRAKNRRVDIRIDLPAVPTQAP